MKIVNPKKNQAEELSTGQAVVMQWEKMSKSKLNGVDPGEVIAEHSCDSVRLFMLGDVAPLSHRNWSPASMFKCSFVVVESFRFVIFWQPFLVFRRLPKTTLVNYERILSNPNRRRYQ